MSAQVKYAYLKGQTWLYRRNYPREVGAVLGRQSLKQSLKTSDIKTARIPNTKTLLAVCLTGPQ